MSNVSKGHGFEREVKKLFTDAGWFCTRAAASQSPMDLIAYRPTTDWAAPWWMIFTEKGYKFKEAHSTKIPLKYLLSNTNGHNIKHIYAQPIWGQDDPFEVVLMQCKINRRRLKQ